MKKTAGVLVLSYLCSNVLFAYTPESSFWSERRRAANLRKSGTSLSLAQGSSPLSNGSASLLTSFPSLTAGGVTGVLSKTVTESVPASFLSLHKELLNALPSSFGTLREISLPQGPSNNKVVVHIQDIHQNLDAQKNIGKAIDSLVVQDQVGLIALEGSVEPIDLEFVRAYPDKEPIRMSADYLLKVNMISGPIHTAYTSSKPLPPVIGVDDPIHYQANIEAYRQSAPRLDSVSRQVKELKTSLMPTKKSVFSPGLLAFDQAVQAYAEERLSLGDFVKAAQMCSPPSLPPTVRAFAEALKEEEALDFKKIELERNEWVERLVKKLSSAEVQGLVDRSLAYRLGNLHYADFYKHLTVLCRTKGVTMDPQGALAGYIRYVLRADEISPETLFKELTAMEKTIYTTLATTDAQRQLVARSRQANLLGKLAGFTLTPSEWADHESLAMATNGSPLPELTSFESFYREAEIRDRSMTANLIKAMTETKAKTSVIVTGGYHAAAMAKALTAEGYTVISFIPKVEKLDTATGSSYLHSFTAEKTPLEKIFEAPQLSLATNPLSPESEEAALGVGLAVSALGKGQRGFFSYFGLTGWEVETITPNTAIVETPDGKTLEVSKDGATGVVSSATPVAKSRNLRSTLRSSITGLVGVGSLLFPQIANAANAMTEFLGDWGLHVSTDSISLLGFGFLVLVGFVFLSLWMIGLLFGSSEYSKRMERRARVLEGVSPRKRGVPSSAGDQPSTTEKREFNRYQGFFTGLFEKLQITINFYDGTPPSVGTKSDVGINMTEMVAKTENPTALYGYGRNTHRYSPSVSLQDLLSRELNKEGAEVKLLELVVYQEGLKQIFEGVLAPLPNSDENRDEKTLNLYLKMMETVIKAKSHVSFEERLNLFFFLLVNAMNQLPYRMAQDLYESLRQNYDLSYQRLNQTLPSFDQTENRGEGQSTESAVAEEKDTFDFMSSQIGKFHLIIAADKHQRARIIEALSNSVTSYKGTEVDVLPQARGNVGVFSEAEKNEVLESLRRLRVLLGNPMVDRETPKEFLLIVSAQTKYLSSSISPRAKNIFLKSLSAQWRRTPGEVVREYQEQKADLGSTLASLLRRVVVAEDRVQSLNNNMRVNPLSPVNPLSERNVESPEQSPRAVRGLHDSVLDPVFRWMIRWASNKEFNRVAHAMDVFRQGFNVVAAPLLETYVFLTLASSLSPIYFASVAVFGFLIAHSAVEWFFDGLTFEEVRSRLKGRLLSAVVYLGLFMVLPVGDMAFWGVSILHGVKNFFTQWAVQQKAKRDAIAMMKIIVRQGDIKSVATENPNTLFPLDSAWSVRLLGVRPTFDGKPDLFVNDMEGQLLSGHSVYSDAFRKEWDEQRVLNEELADFRLSPIVKSLTRVLNPTKDPVQKAIDMAFPLRDNRPKAVGIVVSNENDLIALEDLINKSSRAGTEVSFLAIAKTEELRISIALVLSRIRSNSVDIDTHPVDITIQVADDILEGSVVNMSLMDEIITTWCTAQGTSVSLLVLPEGTLPAVGFLDLLPADSPLRQAVIYILGGVPLQVADFSQALKLGALLARQA